VADATITDIDPVAYLRDIERAWQARDGQAAAAGYTDDAVLLYGNGQCRTGAALRRWPQEWFDYATDLQIKKTFRAFTGDCLASEWESRYTHPQTRKTIRERGAEFFFLRDGKVYRHHMYEHTWPEGENADDRWPTI
jgi:ketosteroid isomerase-like protein